MSLARISFIAAAALALGATAHADTKTSKSGGVSIDIPDAWKAQGNDQLLAVEDPSDQMGMLLIVVDKSDAKQVLAGVDKLLAKSATDIHWSKKQKPMELNGMKGISIDGSAKVNGKPVLTTMMILGPTPTGKGVIAFAGAEPEWLKAHGEELLATFKSLKPVK
jgi:hypothetical protein